MSLVGCLRESILLRSAFVWSGDTVGCSYCGGTCAEVSTLVVRIFIFVSE